MKNIRSILTTLAIFFVLAITANAQTTALENAGEKGQTDNVEVYYFHYERRCATCLTVEKESEKILNELYPEKVKSGKYMFTSVNIEDESNKSLMKKLNVHGQTLLLVKGDKQENITNQAFMYVKSNRDKLKSVIEGVVGNL